MRCAFLAFLVPAVACGRLGFDARTSGNPDGNPGDGSVLPMTRTLAAGSRYACAVHQTEVFCWGANVNGQLGDGTFAPHSIPNPITPAIANPVVLAASDSGGDEPAGGAATTCTIDGNRALFCWGANSRGQVGNGSMQDNPDPSTLILNDVVSVSAGHEHTCAILTSGELRCWGLNSDGQIDGGTQNRSTPTTVPGVNAVEVALGIEHTCARLANGDISCWGGNTEGELGDGTINNNRAPGDVILAGPWIVRAAGDVQTCGVRANNTVECWGSNLFGQLGDGTMNDHRTPQPVSGITDALRVDAGHDGTCALHASGGVSCWGSNFEGETGDGMPVNDRDSPGLVPGVSDFVEVSVGFHFACGRRAGGAVLCWGLNQFGELGIGNMMTPQLIPQQVLLL